MEANRYYWVVDPKRAEPAVMLLTGGNGERLTFRHYPNYCIDQKRFGELLISGPLKEPSALDLRDIAFEGYGGKDG